MGFIKPHIFQNLTEYIPGQTTNLFNAENLFYNSSRNLICCSQQDSIIFQKSQSVAKDLSWIQIYCSSLILYYQVKCSFDQSLTRFSFSWREHFLSLMTSSSQIITILPCTGSPMHCTTMLIHQEVHLIWDSISNSQLYR